MAAIFLEELQKQFRECAPLDLLQKTRQEAWEKFSKIGLPQKRQGAFQYVPLQKLYDRSFALSKASGRPAQVASPHFLPECSHRLVFIDGHYDQALSNPPAQMVVLPLDEAIKAYGGFLLPRFKQSVSMESDPFALLNLSFAKGIFAYLPPKIKLDEPVHCLHILRGENAFATPRMQLFLGRESSAKLVKTTHVYGGSWSCALVDFFVEEGAHFEEISLQDDVAFPVFDALRATLKSHARLNSLSLTRGGQSHRQSFAISLVGEGAHATLDGITLLKSDHSAHIHVVMDHVAPHTSSKQLFKAVVSGTSQSSFEGKIHVAPAAQKTEAYQRSCNLILQEGAQAFCKPNLQIFADDVKASHGATVGQLSESELFYLKTRGIGDEEGKRLLVTAFCQEVGSKLGIPSLCRRFAENLSDFLKEQS